MQRQRAITASEKIGLVLDGIQGVHEFPLWGRLLSAFLLVGLFGIGLPCLLLSNVALLADRSPIARIALGLLFFVPCSTVAGLTAIDGVTERVVVTDDEVRRESLITSQAWALPRSSISSIELFGARGGAAVCLRDRDGRRYSLPLTKAIWRSRAEVLGA